MQNVVAPPNPAQLPADKPSRQAIAAETASKPGKVTGKLAVAITYMVEDGTPWDKAAVKAGLTVRAMRLALQRPHVMKHLHKQRDVFRSTVCGANILRLAQIRDAADNMPAVNAIKELERLGEEKVGGSGGNGAPPGLTIVVVPGGQIGVQAPQPMREVHDLRALDKPSD